MASNLLEASDNLIIFFPSLFYYLLKHFSQQFLKSFLMAVVGNGCLDVRLQFRAKVFLFFAMWTEAKSLASDVSSDHHRTPKQNSQLNKGPKSLRRAL